jgi:transposase
MLKAMLLAERAARTAAEASSQALALMIEKLKFAIAKLRHERFGQSSERAALIEQLELQLADLEENAAEAEVVVEIASPSASSDTVQIRGFERRKPARRPLPGHLPRERIVYPAPSACLCCGGTLRKIGEDVTETLEVVPRQWKVIQHVREKFSAVPARRSPSHPRPRIPLPAAAPGQGCSRMCCSPSMACIYRSTARAQPMPARASISTSLRSPTGWVPQPQP